MWTTGSPPQTVQCLKPLTSRASRITQSLMAPFARNLNSNQFAAGSSNVSVAELQVPQSRLEHGRGPPLCMSPSAATWSSAPVVP